MSHGRRRRTACRGWDRGGIDLHALRAASRDRQRLGLHTAHHVLHLLRPQHHLRTPPGAGTHEGRDLNVVVPDRPVSLHRPLVQDRVGR
eukprot:7388558-Prymnesium_polylepis.1